LRLPGRGTRGPNSFAAPPIAPPPTWGHFLGGNSTVDGGIRPDRAPSIKKGGCRPRSPAFFCPSLGGPGNEDGRGPCGGGKFLPARVPTHNYHCGYCGLGKNCTKQSRVRKAENLYWAGIFKTFYTQLPHMFRGACLGFPHLLRRAGARGGGHAGGARG